mgnify:FL=1
MDMGTERESILTIGRNTIATEARALSTIEKRLDDSFANAVECIHNCRGRLIITGLGKSGHVARKIAATLTSTGTRASFLHATEALHGDVGIIAPDDVVMALSYSGETEEVVRVAEFVATNKNTLIAMTGNNDSSLAKYSDIVLNTHVEDEGTILDIVPTSSTTVQLAMGDAIAAALMHIHNFHASDFARVHPGGYIEKRIKDSNIE